MGMVGKTRFNDLVGHKYGMLTVLSFHSKIKESRKWNCRCDCGVECVKYGHQIRAGQVVSCGCEQRRKASITGALKVVDLTGKRFGRLVVIGRDGSSTHRRVLWSCLCDCGKKKTIIGNHLMSGNTKSCGCIQKETMHDIRWNPNLSKEDREINRSREMSVPGLHIWRKEVYKRDGWHCTVCGDNSSGNLVAHHKNSWSDNKLLRLDVNNGVTICVDCHKEFHGQFGWGRNTEKQWNDFIESKQQRVVTA